MTENAKLFQNISVWSLLIWQAPLSSNQKNVLGRMLCLGDCDKDSSMILKSFSSLEAPVKTPRGSQPPTYFNELP